MVLLNGKKSAGHNQGNSHNQGISVIEIIIALAVATLSLTAVILVTVGDQNFFTSSSLRQDLLQTADLSLKETKLQAEKDFSGLVSTTTVFDSILQKITVESTDLYTKAVWLHFESLVNSSVNFDFKTNFSDFKTAFGGENCTIDPRANWSHPQVEPGTIDLGPGISATDITIKNDTAYITADSATSTFPDFFVVDIHELTHPALIAAINTGPGLTGVSRAGNFAYVANTSINSQLQIIDISDRFNPKTVSFLKLPFTGTSKGTGVSIFYSAGSVYLGTTKADGSEFHVIDVTDPLAPKYLGGFEVGSVANALLIKNKIAYVATANQKQLEVLDVQNPAAIKEVGSFSASGYATQEGESIYATNSGLYFGRSVGGFNNINNHEFFLLSFDTNPLLMTSIDIGASVRKMVAREPLIFMATTDVAKEFQVWDSQKKTLVSSLNFPATASSLRCYKDKLFVTLESSDALRIISTSP